MKQIYVAFADKKIESSFDSLRHGKFEDKQLYEFITKAIQDLKKSPMSGLKIQKRLWPKEYVRTYNLTNLWKYNLPNGWRLVYTIKTDEIMIINVILEWFSHKDYERRFRY